MTREPRCATAARERADPLVGTAAPMRRWLLVEYAGPWAVHALDSERLRGPVARALQEAALAVGGRILLVRRPGRRRPSTEQRWGVLDPDLGQQWGTWTDPSDLLDAARVMRAGPDPSLSPVAGPAAAVLVCTHGLHDTCCAVRGRPVAAALADRWPELVWECSHLGGDRFAANVLIVPDGTSYGRVEPSEAVDVVAGHLDGEVSVEHLRGSSLVPPAAQAALAEVHRRFGPAAPDAFTVASCTRSGPDTTTVTITGAPTSPIVAVVRQRREPPERRTCRAERDLPVLTYAVESLRAR